MKSCGNTDLNQMLKKVDEIQKQIHSLRIELDEMTNKVNKVVLFTDLDGMQVRYNGKTVETYDSDVNDTPSQNDTDSRYTLEVYLDKLVSKFGVDGLCIG